jgi:histidinol-phosphatase (PHP family)
MSPHEIVRAHLTETLEMVETCDRFAILAHIDYAARAWPAGFDRFPASEFEAEIRAVLEALAASGRTLEVNTARPLEAEIIGWWRDAGGETVSFGSDAHRPATLAHSFREVAPMVEAQGFRPGRGPHDLWQR